MIVELEHLRPIGMVAGHTNFLPTVQEIFANARIDPWPAQAKSAGGAIAVDTEARSQQLRGPTPRQAWGASCWRAGARARLGLPGSQFFVAWAGRPPSGWCSGLGKRRWTPAMASGAA